MFAGLALEPIVSLSFSHSNHNPAGRNWRQVIATAGLLALLAVSHAGSAQTVAPPLQVLPDHVPQIVNQPGARFLGPLPDTQKMQLSIVLPLRNQSQLMQLLARLYDPTSADYHKFLSVEEFTDRFGPTEEDYQQVVGFASASGFTVTRQAKNRLIVTIEGTVAQVNSAFHVRIGRYQDPTGTRTFFSPDRNPSVALSTQIAHIDGMDSLSLPQPMYILPGVKMPMTDAGGSGPGGSYLGSDMRAAYYGGSALTGLNQTVALVEFGGYLQSDVDLSFSGAGQTYSVPVQNILVGSATDTVYDQDAEQVLDIVQAIGMAPGLSAVEVYIGDPTSASSPAAVLNQIATDDTAKQISCSWGWIPDSIPAQEAIFQEMAAQGQTFFAASGDNGAFQASISPFFYPGESQYVTAVGGTHLTTVAPGGAWSSEVAWNSEGFGSGGGISPDNLPIPSWQSGLATSSNGGSDTLRNVPDVAAEGDFDNYVCTMGECYTDVAGTSFAAPRWAGFMALVNQQAVEAGNAPLGGIGFIDAALSQIGTGTSYGSDFHDIQSGNNDTDDQTVWFSAVPGYDLVTGWGSPAGQSLINDLAGPATPGFWISSAAGTVNVVEGNNTTDTISVIDAGGFSGKVSLAVTSTLPAGVTASFSPASTGTSSVLTLTASSSAVQGTYPVTITGTSGTITESTTLNLAVHGPSFTLSTSSPTVTVNQGSSTTSTITVNDLYGFIGSVNLQVTGLPTGMTAAFATNPASSTSVLTLTASSSAPNWIGTITVTGTSGALTASTQIYVNLVAPSFTISTFGAVSMGQGATSSASVEITPQNGFNGSVTFSVTGLPTGVTAFFAPNPATSSSELTIVTGNNATVGNATLTITGTSGSITATALLTLTVNAPGFTLNGGGSVSLGQGSTAVSYVYVSDQFGFNGSVALSASGLPAGVTASFATNPTATSSQITFTATSSAAAGTYLVTVTGTAGTVTATTTFTLSVGAPTFTISAPSSQTLSQSGSTGVFVYLNNQFGFNGSVTFSISGLPSGVTASFGTNPTTYSSELTLAATSAAATGNYPLTITGTSGSISKATTMTLTIVAPGIQVTGPSSVTLGIGTSSTAYVYVSANNGYNGNVTLSVSGLPSGITASFSPNPVSLTGYSSSSQLTLTASGSVAAGSYTATLTGTSGTTTASTSITMTVAAPSFTLSNYSSPAIDQGESASTYIYVNDVNGFNSSVTLSASGLPTGVTAAFGINPTTSSSQLTFSATDSAPTGTYAVTVTGTSGTLSATTTVTITVATPSFTLSPGQTTYSLNQGASDPSYIDVIGANGFSGPVTLSASGLPSGVTLSFGTNPATYYSAFTLTATSTATPGTSTVTITGTFGTVTASTAVMVTVNAGSFTLTPAPGSITLLPGGAENTTVSVNPLYGFGGNVSFSISGLPSGVTSSWNPASSAAGSVLTLTASTSALPGTATATITGTSGLLSATAPLPITIRSPGAEGATALAITAGGSTVSTVNWGSLVTLTASVTSGGSPVTSGLVNFCDSAATYCGDVHLLGSAQLTSAGTASINLLPLPGSHSYKAVFAGTAAVGGSSSAVGSLQVTGAYPTTTSLASSGAAGSYTLNATVNGNGPQALTGSFSFVDTSTGNSVIASSKLTGATPALTWTELGTTPTAPYFGAIVTGDFNGDGITDVAILDTQIDAIVIQLGNPDGTFTISNLSPQTSAYPVAITAADFNGDGKLDLAVLNQGGIVNIFLGNGDGTFNPVGTSTNIAVSASTIAAGDFNGDGIPDLAVADTSNSRLVILLGKGDGTFTTSASYPATGASPVSMAVADFNGDGIPDIAVGSYSGTITVLLGNGDGTFSALPNTLSVGTDPASIAVADFNGDGKPDLAVGSYYSSTLSVLLGSGNGTFTAAASPTVDYSSSAVVPMDVNQDGVVDLVVTSAEYSSATVLLGSGTGAFTQAASVTLPGSVSNAAAGRVTANGYPALIAAFGSLDETGVLEPYMAQSATGSATGVSLAPLGSHEVAASYSGDANYAASQSPTVTLQGTKSQPVITWSTPASISYGTPLGASQLNATANVPGTFVYSPAAGAVPGVGPQTLSVTFTPTDTTDYTSATASVTLTVNQATPTITWATPAAIVYGTALSSTQLDATASAAGSFVYNPASGAVLKAGPQPLSATFTPTDTTDYTTATASATLTVNPATPAISVSAAGGPSSYGAPVTLTATVTRDDTNTVTFYNGNASLGTAAPNSGTAILITGSLPVGSDSISATIAAGGNYTSATSSATAQVVSPLASSVAIAPANSGAFDTSQPEPVTITVTGAGPAPTGTVILSAVYVPSGAIVYTSSATPLASGSATIAIPANTFTSTGSYALTAAYSGNSVYTSTSSAPANVSVNPPYQLSTSTPTAVNPGSSGTATITLTSDPNYSGSVSLTCVLTSSPAGAADLPACSVTSGSPVTIANGTASGAATVTMTTTAATSSRLAPNGLPAWTRAGGGLVLSLLVFLGVPARRRNWRNLLGLVIVIIALGALSSCGGGPGGGGGGGGGNPGTTAGNYTFTVTGAGNPAITPAPTVTVKLTVN